MSGSAAPAELAAREVEVALGLGGGLTIRQVAEQLEVTESTVRSIAQVARGKIAAGAELPRRCGGPECLRPVTDDRQTYCCPQCRNRRRKMKAGGRPIPLVGHPRRESPVPAKPGRQYPPTRRQLEIAHMLFVQGFTFARTARILGIHPGEVACSAHRIRKKLGLLGVHPVAMRNELERLGYCVDLYSALDDRPYSPRTRLYLAAFDLLLSLSEGHSDAPACRRVMTLARGRAGLPSHGPRRTVTTDLGLWPALKHLDLPA